MKSIFDSLLKVAGNEYASKVSDGIVGGDVLNYVDTGSYALNALISGSIYGGVQSNKIVVFVGEESTGKTFFALSCIKNFLDTDPNAAVFYFESESALTKEMFESRNIDSSRVYIMPVETVEQWRTENLKILENYLNIPIEDRSPMLCVMDSLGNMSTIKELTDVSEGNDKRDMTKAQLLKGAFRTLGLKLGKANVPLIATNHVYAVIGSMYGGKEQSGGSGSKYNASGTIFLSKRKETEGKDVIGSILTCRIIKSRFTREGKKVEVKLLHESGLDRYHGLLDLAVNAGVLNRLSKQYEVVATGEKFYGKHINENPEAFYTKDVLDAIDEAAKKEFLYGSTFDIDTEDSENE